MTPFVNVNESLPFIVSSILCLFGWVFVFTLKNEFPEQEVGILIHSCNTIKRFSKSYEIWLGSFLAAIFLWLFRIIVKRQFSHLCFKNEY